MRLNEPARARPRARGERREREKIEERSERGREGENREILFDSFDKMKRMLFQLFSRSTFSIPFLFSIFILKLILSVKLK